MTIQIRVNKSCGGFLEGHIATVQVKDGVPVNKFWRDRLVDSEYDDCVSIVEKPKPKAKTKTSDQEDDSR